MCVIGAAEENVMRVFIVTNDSELLLVCLCWSCSVCVAVIHGLKLDLYFVVGSCVTFVFLDMGC